MLETIKVVNSTELGYMIINLEDYDENIHDIYEIEAKVTLNKARKSRLQS